MSAIDELFGGADETASKAGKAAERTSTYYDEGPTGVARRTKNSALRKAEEGKKYTSETVDEASTLAGLGVSSLGSTLAGLLSGPTGWLVLGAVAYFLFK